MSKILIVDDSTFSRKILTNLIKSLNHTILEANDGISALEQFALYKPDIVFLDMTMVGMNGIDVLTNFKQINPNIPVIIATADVQRATKEKVVSLGAVAFIEKPFNKTDVLNAVQTYLVDL